MPSERLTFAPGWYDLMRLGVALFQVAGVDDGTVRRINADLVSHVLPRV